ncbi:hypothetical protein BT69DRAFT_663684 [Atractiella rhizophila]|nr:hypothetical protein BT69DRAFT_663684 [Atractiella rhizophila]
MGHTTSRPSPSLALRHCNPHLRSLLWCSLIVGNLLSALPSALFLRPASMPNPNFLRPLLSHTHTSPSRPRALCIRFPKSTVGWMTER